MKKIRIDYYRFRLKKGRVDVLLQKVEGKEEFCIPHHYVKKDERIVHSILSARMEDDGDLVLVDVAINDCNLDMTGLEWVPIKNLLNLSLSRNESFHVWHNVLRFFLDLSPNEGESGNVKMAEEILENIRVLEARKKYLDWLQGLLDGEVMFLDGHMMSKPDPILVRREMETLEHFRVCRPHENAMSQRDGDLLDRDEYYFEPVDVAIFRP